MRIEWIPDPDVSRNYATLADIFDMHVNGEYVGFVTYSLPVQRWTVTMPLDDVTDLFFVTKEGAMQCAERIARERKEHD